MPLDQLILEHASPFSHSLGYLDSFQIAVLHFRVPNGIGEPFSSFLQAFNRYFSQSLELQFPLSVTRASSMFHRYQPLRRLDYWVTLVDPASLAQGSARALA